MKLAGREARIYVLFEHQSTIDPLLPFRVLAYEVRIWESWLRLEQSSNRKDVRLPPIVPVLLAQVEGEWKASTELIDLFDFADEVERAALAPLLPQLSVLKEDLAVLTEKALDERVMPETAKLALAVLKYERQRLTFEGMLERLARRIEDLPDTREAREMLRAVLHYAGSRRGLDLQTVQTAVARVAPGVEDKVMSFITDIEARGEARGEARALLKQLAIRFPPLSEETKATVLAADEATVDRWIARVLTAPSLEALLAD